MDPHQTDSNDQRIESSAVCPPDSSAPGTDQAFIVQLLLEQQELTAVDQFLQNCHSGRNQAPTHYRHRLPVSVPASGQQYAFEVDLDRCSGCKACVTACHSLNGLDEHETWRDVGLLLGGATVQPVMQHVTAACHHCLEPGCLLACPVDAYHKDPVTGIVHHLDDQCIGCQYCTFACPYEAPKYHAKKGIVRKCDMCSDRLSHGESPACVQACPHQAISIRIVDLQQVIEDAELADFLPAAPDSQITLPTTSYRTSRVFPKNMLPADYYEARPQHPHWALIVMLVLTQLSVGALLVGLLLDRHLEPAGRPPTMEQAALLFSLPAVDESTIRVAATDGLPRRTTQAFRRIHATSALGFGLLALAASTLHLGRPQYAFRAVIGLRHSWLSREIVAFAAFAAAACGFAAMCWTGRSGLWPTVLGWAVAASGSTGIFCSAMVYAVTGRPWWNLARTAGKFFLTAAILGIASIWLTIVTFVALGMTPDARLVTGQIGRWLVPALVVTSAGKLLMEISVFRHLLDRRQSPLKRTAFLLAGPLSNATLARFACGLLGGIVMPLFLLAELKGEGEFEPSMVISAILLLSACLAGELLERYQFFAACAAPRMPGRLS